MKGSDAGSAQIEVEEEYMFLRTQFVFYDFGEPLPSFFMDYLAVMALFAGIAMAFELVTYGTVISLLHRCRKRGIEVMEGQSAVSMVLQQIHNCNKRPLLVAIDGRCGAGKTTLAALLKEEIGCNVIHMDHFFLQPRQRTRERMQKPGSNVDYERFFDEVMIPLSQGRAFSYRQFDCQKMELSSLIQMEQNAVTVVEGSYSCHPVLWDFYDLRVFLNIGPEEQIQRIRSRNGNEAVSRFRDGWIPLEEQYFNAYRIQERCDLVLKL